MLLLAAAGVVLLDPWAVLSSGFWLSFGAALLVLLMVLMMRQAKVSAAAIAEAGIEVQVVNKVTEGRPHVVDMIKNNEIALVINTVEERRNAIADSRAIRTSSLLARVTTFTTIAGAEAAVEGMKYMDQLEVISVQDMHAQLAT